MLKHEVLLFSPEFAFGIVVADVAAAKVIDKRPNLITSAEVPGTWYTAVEEPSK